MSLEGTLARARAAAERLMVDTWVVGTEVRSDEMDEHDNYTYSIPNPVYSGPGLLEGASVRPTEVEAGGALLVLTDPVLKLPVETSVGVRPGMTARCTVAPHDPRLVGVEVEVLAPHHETLAKERRFPVREVSR